MKTKILVCSLGLVAALLTTQVVTAQAPSGAPANATGLCKDGTYYTGANKQGACRGHQGVKEWYGSPASTSKAGSTASGSAAATSAPASANPSEPAKSESSSKEKTSTVTQAPGGGAGQVWVNTASNVYHCPGTKYYGKTKAGEYMTEAQAQAKGAHPDHGKPCK